MIEKVAAVLAGSLVLTGIAPAVGYALLDMIPECYDLYVDVVLFIALVVFAFVAVWKMTER